MGETHFGAASADRLSIPTGVARHREPPNAPLLGDPSHSLRGTWLGSEYNRTIPFGVHGRDRIQGLRPRCEMKGTTPRIFFDDGATPPRIYFTCPQGHMCCDRRTLPCRPLDDRINRPLDASATRLRPRRNIASGSGRNQMEGTFPLFNGHMGAGSALRRMHATRALRQGAQVPGNRRKHACNRYR